MRKFIFITNEGCCEDPEGFPVENSQVLGYAGGEDAEDAFGKLKLECQTPTAKAGGLVPGTDAGTLRAN